MPRWSARPLSVGERALCGEVFGRDLDLDRIRIWSCPPLGWTLRRPFCAGGLLWPGRSLIVYPPAQARSDFSDAPLGAQGVFIHEVTHVWQSQQGVNLLWAKLRAGDSAVSYAYELTPGCAWSGFNIEQQAMLVQHAFMGRRGGACPYAPEDYRAVLPFKVEGDRRP